MATVITQDRQIASLVPPVGKNRIVVSVKSKAGAGLYIESRSGSQTKSWLYRPYLNGKQIKINVILALMAFNEQKTLISVGQLDTNSGYQR